MGNEVEIDCPKKVIGQSQIKMKAALAVNHIFPDVKQNLTAIEQQVHEAADHKADLVLFSETALTGLINNSDPAHDLELGEPIPGPATERLSKLAVDRHIYIGLGLFEREAGRLFDTAILLTPEGDVGLKYRRMHPQWHARRADPAVYCHGSYIPVFSTPQGRFAFLLCGDLFDDAIVEKMRKLKPDWLLFPFARCFLDGSYDQNKWDEEELPAYVERVRLAGVTTLMVNYLSDAKLGDGNSFGGAFVVSPQGQVLNSFPLGKKGILYMDL